LLLYRIYTFPAKMYNGKKEVLERRSYTGPNYSHISMKECFSTRNNCSYLLVQHEMGSRPTDLILPSVRQQTAL